MKKRMARTVARKKGRKTQVVRAVRTARVSNNEQVAVVLGSSIDRSIMDAAKIVSDRHMGSSLLAAAVTGLIISGASDPDELARQADEIVQACVRRVNTTMGEYRAAAENVIDPASNAAERG